MPVDDFSFDLPEGLIASFPADPPDECRLLNVDKKSGSLKDSLFTDLPNLLEEGDLLVVNNSAVEARRIFTYRTTGGKKGARIETVFLEKISNDPQLWKALIRKRQRLKDGEILISEKDPGFTFRVHKKEDGRTFLEPKENLNYEVFKKIGQMPIPPYLKREEEKGDRENYQNPFGENYGSAAAPTAALHFTPRLRRELAKKKIRSLDVTLHVGYGTFAPLTEENFRTSSLHEEYYRIDPETAKILSEKDYNRLICVGTTALRALETVHRKTGGKYDECLEGKTDIFLRPPEQIRSVDGLITNFHLPGSSLIMLVACLLPQSYLMEAYRHAIEKKYRFFSYGDAMLIL